MSILDFLFPPTCKICNSRVKKGAVCPFCFDELQKKAKPSVRTLYINGRQISASYLFEYENETVKKLLFALKKSGNGELFKYAADLYGKSLENLGQKSECAVVNVPRSKENVRKYGYDHVKNPCRILCKKRERLVFSPVLKRSGHSQDQKNLDISGRKSNVSGKFTAVKKDIPQNILLVDDVVTTASTVTECVRQLLKMYPYAEISCIFLASASSDFSRKGQLEY